MFYDVLWCSMVPYDVLWCSMMFYDVLWWVFQDDDDDGDLNSLQGLHCSQYDFSFGASEGEFCLNPHFILIQSLSTTFIDMLNFTMSLSSFYIEYVFPPVYLYALPWGCPVQVIWYMAKGTTRYNIDYKYKIESEIWSTSRRSKAIMDQSIPIYVIY